MKIIVTREKLKGGGRRRPNIKKLRPKHKPRTSYEFVLVPRPVLTRPPIQHRHTDEKSFVIPFDFSVLGAVLCLAHASMAEINHQVSMAAGKDAMGRQRRYIAKFKRKWERVYRLRAKGIQAKAPTMRYASTPEIDIRGANGKLTHYHPEIYDPHKPEYKTGKAICREGEKGYKRSRLQLRRTAPDEVMVVTSAWKLVKLAGHDDSGHTLERLYKALNRLSFPIGTMPALLDVVPSDAEGKLTLAVRGEWLHPPYAKIRLPLPKKATPLALNLFLHSIETRPDKVKHDDGITFFRLCHLLNIPTAYGNARATAALERALMAVNSTRSDKFDATTIQDDKVRFVVLDKHEEEEPDDVTAEIRSDEKYKRYQEDRRRKEEINEKIREQLARERKACEAQLEQERKKEKEANFLYNYPQRRLRIIET